MKKLLYIFLFLSLPGHAQTTTVKINDEVKNTKTSKHINIPGTRLYIIPPPGFTVASNFIGLQKGSFSMVNIYDLVGGDMNSNAATFSKVKFEKKELKFLIIKRSL